MTFQLFYVHSIVIIISNYNKENCTSPFKIILPDPLITSYKDYYQ